MTIHSVKSLSHGGYRCDSWLDVSEAVRLGARGGGDVWMGWKSKG